jgi:hypothetical protein
VVALGPKDRLEFDDGAWSGAVAIRADASMSDVNLCAAMLA